jgi:hypothetical protein
MPVEVSSFAATTVQGTEELAEVSRIADELHAHLNSPEALRQIADANQPGAPSHAAQSVFRDFALRLGFADESKGLFASYETSALRPDYFRKMSTSVRHVA